MNSPDSRFEGGDPFEIPNSEIPKGKSYQWITKSVTGEERIFDQTKKFEKNGWKLVPYGVAA